MDPIIGAGLANNAGNIASTILTNRANMKLAQYGYEQERQMIAEQNAYNSPVEQMKRYQEAGLNPNLIYGNGVSSAGNQQSIAHYNAPSLDAPKIDLNTIIPTLFQVQREKANISNLEKQNYILDQQGFQAHQEYMSKLMDNIIKSELLGYDPGLVFTDEDRQKVRNSVSYLKASAEAQNEIYRGDLIKAQTAFQKLSSSEKSFFLKNIQPLVLKYQELQNELIEKKIRIE